MKERKRDYTVAAVSRSLRILEALGSKREVGVLELSKTVGINITTVFRLLNTLMSRGFVEQSAESEKYRLGIKMFELGMARIRHFDFQAVAVPYLSQLHEELKETVFLSILRSTEALMIAEFFRPQGIIFRSQVGAGEPLYCTGIGKALLAHLEPQLQNETIKKLKLAKVTQNTIVEKPQLRKHLAQIQRQGYSLDNEEIIEGVRCVAAPIIDHTGYAVAAFSVAGPSARMQANLQTIISRVLETSQTISAQLGQRQPTRIAEPVVLGMPRRNVR
ncbi:MAG: IclR family transcriptional regulator [Longimicrobiales bacterium]